MSEKPSPEDIQRVADALAAGRKIEAIKLYREATGVGLAEAKDAVETLIPELQKRDPEKYAALSASRRSGCASAFFVCAGFALVILISTWG